MRGFVCAAAGEGVVGGTGTEGGGGGRRGGVDRGEHDQCEAREGSCEG